MTKTASPAFLGSVLLGLMGSLTLGMALIGSLTLALGQPAPPLASTSVPLPKPAPALRSGTAPSASVPPPKSAVDQSASDIPRPPAPIDGPASAPSRTQRRRFRPARLVPARNRHTRSGYPPSPLPPRPERSRGLRPRPGPSRSHPRRAAKRPAPSPPISGPCWIASATTCRMSARSWASSTKSGPTATRRPVNSIYRSPVRCGSSTIRRPRPTSSPTVSGSRSAIATSIRRASTRYRIPRCGSCLPTASI